MFKSVGERDISTAWKEGFVRVGKCPAGGKSYNYRDGKYEDGVSVYRAWFSAEGGLRVIDLRGVDVASAMFVWAEKDEKGVYQVLGQEVGCGSDGEPVLKKQKQIKVKKSGIAPVIRALF